MEDRQFTFAMRESYARVCVLESANIGGEIILFLKNNTEFYEINNK